MKPNHLTTVYALLCVPIFTLSHCSLQARGGPYCEFIVGEVSKLAIAVWVIVSAQLHVNATAI